MCGQVLYILTILQIVEQITWANQADNNFRSVQDVFENGASFRPSATIGGIVVSPNYTADQMFEVADGKTVRLLTSSAGALKCPRTSRC